MLRVLLTRALCGPAAISIFRDGILRSVVSLRVFLQVLVARAFGNHALLLFMSDPHLPGTLVHLWRPWSIVGAPLHRSTPSSEARGKTCPSPARKLAGPSLGRCVRVCTCARTPRRLQPPQKHQALLSVRGRVGPLACHNDPHKTVKDLTIK